MLCISWRRSLKAYETVTGSTSPFPSQMGQTYFLCLMS